MSNNACFSSLIFEHVLLAQNDEFIKFDFWKAYDHLSYQMKNILY